MAHPVVVPGPLVPVQPGPRRTWPWGDEFNWDEYSKYLAKRGGPTPRSVNMAAGPQTQAIDASPNLPIVYGINRIRGQLMTARQNPDANPALFWFALAVGEIDNLVMVDGNWQMWVNGIEVFNPLNGYNTVNGTAYQIQLFTGSQAQAEDPNLYNHLGWHPGGLAGVAYARVQIYPMTWNWKYSWVYSIPGVTGDETYPSVPDNIQFDFDIQGKKVYDPRLNGGAGGIAWSQNPALHWRDLRVMSGVDPTLINDVTFQIAADNCDTPVPPEGYKRFLSNLVVSSKANLESYLDQLSLACNGHEYWTEGKMCLHVDVENTSDPVLTLDSERNFSTINYTWIDQKERPTQVRVDFRNKNSKPPYTNDFVLVPENLEAGIEPVLSNYTSSVITDRLHAARAATYIYKVANLTPFRAEGDCTFEGINALPRGTKVLLKTSEGVTQEMLVDVAREMSTGWHMALRQYADNVYTDIFVSGSEPIGYVPTVPPTELVPATVTGLTVVQSPVGIWWLPPRLYDAGWDVTQVSGYWKVDCGSSPQTMCRFMTDSATCGDGVQFSVDGNTWMSVSRVTHNYIYKNDQSGVEYHVLDWTTDSIPYRYWRLAGSGGTNTKFFAPVGEIDPSIIGYDIHDGFQGSFGPPTYGNPTELDPIVAHVPATTQISHLTPFDLSSWLITSGQYDGWVAPTVTAVRRNGFVSRGLSKAQGGCTGARFIAAQPASTATQSGVSIDIGGDMHAATLVSSGAAAGTTGGTWVGVIGDLQMGASLRSDAAAGTAAALPATPQGYVGININGVPYVIPIYPVP